MSCGMPWPHIDIALPHECPGLPAVGRRRLGSEWDRSANSAFPKADACPNAPCARSAALRAFSPTSCITQRNPAYRRSPMLTETRCSVTGLGARRPPDQQIPTPLGRVRLDSGCAAGQLSWVQLDREGPGNAAPGSGNERGTGDIPAAAQGTSDDPTAPAATTTTSGTRSFPPGRATLTASSTSISASAVTAAWERARCSQ